MKRFLLILMACVLLCSAVGASAEELLYQKGSKGKEVTIIQTALIEQGYLKSKADGSYGNKTVAAVKAFQEANGLRPTGIVGELTYGLLVNGAKPETSKEPIFYSDVTLDSTVTDVKAKFPKPSYLNEKSIYFTRLYMVKQTIDGVSKSMVGYEFDEEGKLISVTYEYGGNMQENLSSFQPMAIDDALQVFNRLFELYQGRYGIPMSDEEIESKGYNPRNDNSFSIAMIHSDEVAANFCFYVWCVDTENGTVFIELALNPFIMDMAGKKVKAQVEANYEIKD